jgi:cephalosporin hydroxylase
MATSSTAEIITIDMGKSSVTIEDADASISYPMGTLEAFSVLSRAWLRCGWDNKYVYSFTWLGRPVIQLPEDLIRVQEVIFTLKPDVIIETGVAHGGSAIFYASLCKLMGRGRVIAIDIEIRPHNRQAIEEHELFEYITLIEGNSVDPRVVEAVRASIEPRERVFVMLDSNHTKHHVMAELEAYAELVSVGSYIVAADGIMADLVGAPRSREDWSWNNPRAAAEEFVGTHSDFVIAEPAFLFNEGTITERVTYWPGAWLRRQAE